MPLPLTYPRRRSRTAITIAGKVPLWRFALAVLLCLTSLWLSCSRQQSRTPPPTNASPQAQTAQQNSPAPQGTPPQDPGAQARAVIVAALAFSPDGTRLASASADGVRVWDSASGNSIYAFTLPSKWAEQVAFNSDGQVLAASAGADDEGGNSYIEVHDAATGAKIHSIKLDWNNAAPLAITPDGRLLSSGGAGEDGEYVYSKAWELRTGRELKTLQVLFNAFSADGRWGASLEFRQGTQINLWDIAAGRRVRTIALPGFQASRVVFTPDGSRILAASRNGPEVKLFEIATGKEVKSLPIPAGAGVIAFSGDGKWLAAASGSSVAIWDLPAGHELQMLAGQLSAQDLTFSSDGRLLITGGPDWES